ncbi:helix-turn-helix domain-containing protein [Oricola sp.]|uniref:GlxA family transcriptional regulator n=1 Tax=Oricola sp. TaxID=1979950 RepID=UPI0025E96269|nr:helix-turn-helix domain-containing protein [Oricola sp.]MCI5073551.1 helix-turn-helix domain-containing protein [Oricola sp.]
MADENTKARIRTAILALPETTPTAMYGMFEILSSVGVVWQQVMGDGQVFPRFEVELVAVDDQPFCTLVGVPVTPGRSVVSDDVFDLVIVTDIDIRPDCDPREAWPEVAEWLSRQYAAGATICSVCTGAVLLARAGLLDGIEATTHWMAVGIMTQCFPGVLLRPERILQPAGKEHRIITAGGMSAWQDLLLYLIARYAGEEEARRAAKVYLLGDRSEGQLPFAAMLPRQHEDAVIGKCQEWVGAHYDDPAPVARMAALSGLNERTFKRRFKAATGFAPIDYVQSLRVEEAKHLLETSDMPTDQIGREVGYEEPAFFRRLFKRKTGTTLARYRQRFRRTATTGTGREPDRSLPG